MCGSKGLGPSLKSWHGTSHSLVRTEKCEVFAWGSNAHGQLGDGSTHDSLRPKRILPEGIRAVAAGRRHSLAVSCDGEVLAWGSNEGGLLGTGLSEKQLLPARVIASGVQAVAAGETHSLALTASGEVFAWGGNKYGQLGDGSTSPSRKPLKIALPGTVCRIAAGWHHSLAVTERGEVFGWGFNTPDRTPPGFRSASVPTMIINGGIRMVAAGGAHSLALTQAGEVMSWGGNDHGQLGDGTRERRTWPVRLEGWLPPLIHLAAGGYHSLAVTEEYEVLFWGSSMTGPRLLPAKVHFEDGMHSVAGGGVHSLVAGLDGAVFAWGGNTCGQVGDGSNVDRDTHMGPVLGPNTIEIKTKAQRLAEAMSGPAEIADEDVAEVNSPGGRRANARGEAQRSQVAITGGASTGQVPRLLVQMTGGASATAPTLQPLRPAQHDRAA